MKLLEYIHNPIYLNNDNIITLEKYEELIRTFIQNNTKYKYLHLSQEFLEYENIIDYFSSHQNSIILISSPDIDFPPPKKPYSYDKFANFSNFPDNYLNVCYNDKIYTELIPIIEKNNLHVFVHACSIHNKNIINIPIGVFPKFNHFHFKTNEKNILCYANFGLHVDRWYGNPRQKVYEFIKNKSFMLCENIIPVNLLNRNCLDFNNFYENLSKSKFALCPRGCGIDTYRLWDCICLGCIPIVEKYDGHNNFIDLPILFIEKYEDYNNLTEEFLNEKYKLFLERDFNYELLNINYWFSKLLLYN